MAFASGFGTWDYVSLFIIFLATCAPGFYNIFKTKKNNTVRDFLVASHGLGSIPIILSMAVTTVSSMSFTLLPADVYKNGMIFFMHGFGSIPGLGVSALLYVPVFVNLKVGSIFEYFELRFNIFVRFLFSAVFLIQDIFNTAMITYACALTFNQVCNLDVWIATAIMSLVTITYTAFGGFKTVVWTDVAQSAVFAVSAIIILVKGVSDLGGVEKIWNINREGNRTNFFILEQSQDSAFTFWTLLIGSPVLLMTYGCHQSLIQRSMACGSIKKAFRLTFGSAFVIAGLMIFLSSFGLLIYAKYKDCDPLKSDEIAAYDQIMPLFATETLQYIPGLTGLFLAGIVSAAVSSLSSNMNSSTCLIVEDFIKHFFPVSGEYLLVVVSKIITVVYGLLCVAAVLLIQKIDGILQALFIIRGITLGPQIGYFTIGMLSPWTSTLAASVGYIVSVAFVGWVSIGTMITKPFVPSAPISVSGCNISGAVVIFNSSFYNNTTITTAQDTINDAPFYLYTFNPILYSCWGMTIVVVVGLFVTLIAPQNPELVDPKFLFPFITKLLKRLPDKTKRRLGFDPARSKFFLTKKNEATRQGMQDNGSNVAQISQANISNESQISLEKMSPNA